MSRIVVHASVDTGYRRHITATTLRQWARTVLQHLDLQEDIGLDVAVTDEATVQALNREHRGLDETTDVLSFPFSDRAAQAPYYGATKRRRAPTSDFVVPPSEARSLGEVVIAFPYAQRQAAAAGHSVRDELALLLTHGILHLLGHDHQEREEELRMWAETERLLALLAPKESADLSAT